MKYTAAHWGAYRFQDSATDLDPVPDDPEPSRIGRGWVSAARNRNTRILKPAVRKGWLDGDQGQGRCDDSYVELGWDRTLDLAASEVARIREKFGNQAIFGGSYGWSSAGRFHHAQSQMRRFLALAGGFTSSRETYSHAAAEVLFPHILGMSNKAFQDEMTAMPLVADHCDLVLAFGGLNRRTAQINSAGTTRHEVGPWAQELIKKGVRVIAIAPERPETASEWWPIRPGTDTALILALINEVLKIDGQDDTFLANCTSGWETLRAYILGESDGVAKSADWAAQICDLQADTIRDLARDLVRVRSLVSMAWGMQRADHGEQPIWAGLALAAVLGQIGQPGTGYAFGYGSTTAVGRASRLIPWPSLPMPRNTVGEYIPVARIADMLLKPGQHYIYNGVQRSFPDIRLIWWSGGNPYHHHQDLRRLERAWVRPETVIVNDHAWTATARRADIVFPATTPLERHDIMMNRRDPTLIYMSPMFEPLGEARDDFEIFADLSERMGFRDQFTEGLSSQGWLERLWSKAGQVARDHGFSVPEFGEFRAAGRYDIPGSDEQRVALEQYVRDPESKPLATESGKITLTNARIAAMALETCPGHPTWMPSREGARLKSGEFHLISGQPDTRLHGQNDMGSEAQAAKQNGREICTMHPDAAAALGVAGGDFVRLFNDRGAVLAGLKTSLDIRLDCVSLPTGAWYDPQVVDGSWIEVHGNPNALTLDIGCSDLSQGNIAHSCAVRVEKWHGALPELRVDRPPKLEAG